ncbi:protein kinase C-binding protein 1 isoform X2 [Leptopilina heterotoma]|uniref:protein kinase C-binding protein 1 isoform X2 n=1 Tax=Leptopilina heterotoma TaxID=63436 RepID=UPI001CA80900|nr:protein kinase C-binding protein 1 isoform X2 [Leptopilina heterotoma]XP_043469640.1 protein kinase C-binding protein 1 isoform X2 [Leptopilina heterotoma]
MARVSSRFFDTSSLTTCKQAGKKSFEGVSWCKGSSNMDSLNCSTDNTTTTSLSSDLTQNEIKSASNNTEQRLNSDKEISTEIKNDVKVSSTSDVQTDQRNYISTEDKDTRSAEYSKMIQVLKDDLKLTCVLSDVQTNEVEKDVKEQKEGRRKRKSTSTQERDSASEDNAGKAKKKKVQNSSDKFCWRCHKETVDVQCSACPRSWHRKCIGGAQLANVQSWICGECATILKAENAETRSEAMSQLSVDQLCMLLKHIIDRMRDYPGSEPFWKEVDTKEVSNYMEYVVKPMDLCLLENNVKSKLYGSTDAFMADAKWIQHNCIVFNTSFFKKGGGVYADPSKLTSAAKQIVKVARQEVSELEACPDCYMHGRNLPRPLPSWFIEPCRRPHPIVWAKLKGFPFWPAKALPRINGAGYIDVRFFGEHDRAWVVPKDVFLYSEEPPQPLPRKKKNEMDECVREVARHCRKLEMVFGEFKFAPPRIQYNPNDQTQIQIMLPNYDSTANITKSQSLALKKRPSFRNRWDGDSSSREDVNSSTEKTNSSLVKSIPVTPGIAKKRMQRKSIGSSPVIEKEDPVVMSMKKLETYIAKASDIKLKIKPAKNQKKDEPETATPLPELTIVVNKTSGNLKTNSTDKPNEETVPKSPVKDSKSCTPKIAPKIISSFLATSTPKIALKPIKPNTNKLYNPKKTIIEKINAVSESKASESKESVSTLETESQNKSAAPSVETNSSVVRYYVLTGDKSVEVKKVSAEVANQAGQKIVSPVKQEPRDIPLLKKKQSKAKKSFPNRPPNFSFLSKTTAPPVDAMVYIPPQSGENSISQKQLPPPEAGPFSSKLHQRSLELAKRMAQMMEEALRETVLENSEIEQTSGDACQAKIHFLKLEIERMRWQHQQQLDELRYNTDRTLKEMRASLEAERLRAVAETRKHAEEDKQRCVEEIKKKQWCAMCGREALFYCCWNTAYCDYPCQQKHWPLHMSSCAQNPPSSSSVVTNAPVNVSINDQSQVMPRLQISSQNVSTNSWVA